LVLVIERNFRVYERSSKVYQGCGGPGCLNLEFHVWRDCADAKATEEFSIMAAGQEEKTERSAAIATGYRPSILGARMLFRDCGVGVEVDLGNPELKAWGGVKNKDLDNPINLTSDVHNRSENP
jgi:hypothetical protein